MKICIFKISLETCFLKGGYIHPDPENLNSPATRKKKRVKPPLYVLYFATDSNCLLPTTKPSRSVRGRGRQINEQMKRGRTPPASELDEDGTEEVAGIMMSPPPASSDDFEGYD